MATKKAKTTSKILASVHEAVRDLEQAGLVDAVTMRKFDALCLPPVPALDSAEVRRIRKKTNTSQAVFAAALNVGPETVASWERKGGRTPSGTALKLLELVDRKGLEALF